MEKQETKLEVLYPGIDCSRIPTDLQEVLPRDKSDTERAMLAVKLGYPEVEILLPHLIRWLQDYNWPVAQILAPFFSSIGLPLEKIIRTILKSKDEVWKYWVLTLIVDVKNLSLAEALKLDLELLLGGDNSEDVPEVAQKILKRLGL